MELSFIEVAAILIGILIRFAIPIALTALIALFLKWLDRRWQAEAEADAAESAQRAASVAQERQPCWEIHNCPPKMRKDCKAYLQPDTPCWEIFRTNGQLKPACKTCKVPPPEVIGRIAYV
ncbi:MAG: hypothetical protein GWP61_19725 [Chloroflexi bacterium]|jgi:hypothetical protein|nr:hypothetical protein [Chloroflexota bacterium]